MRRRGPSAPRQSTQDLRADQPLEGRSGRIVLEHDARCAGLLQGRDENFSDAQQVGEQSIELRRVTDDQHAFGAESAQIRGRRLGVGAGAFAWANSSGDFGRPMFMQAHNLYIQILATTGLVGFFVWFIFIFNFSKNLRYLMNKVRGRPEHRWIRVYAVSFAICMISLFISGLFAHSLYRYTWYMMAGLTAVLTFLGDQVDQENIRTGETIESRQLQSK